MQIKHLVSLKKIQEYNKAVRKIVISYLHLGLIMISKDMFVCVCVWDTEERDRYSFNTCSCVFRDLRVKKMIGEGLEKDGLYYLDM